MVMEGAWTWGGEHKIQCIDDVLWICAPETYNFVSQYHPNRFNKGKNIYTVTSFFKC